MITKLLCIIISISFGVMHSEFLSAQGNKQMKQPNFASVDKLFSLCMDYKEQIVKQYNSDPKRTFLDDSKTKLLLSQVKELVTFHESDSTSPVSSPLKYYHVNCKQYLDRIKEVFDDKTNLSLAPFQYNELILLYSQTAISHSIVLSALSYLQMQEKIQTSVVSIDKLRKAMDSTLVEMNCAMNANFISTSTSIKNMDCTVSKTETKVIKNENRMKWALGITGVTGVVTIGILILTLLQ